jgi:hypothetical protein
MKIPRLVVIEIEHKYNTGKKKDVKNIPDARRPEYDIGKETRISFQTMKEILSIRKDGASILPNLNMSLLHSFTPLAGRGFADTWIRREISDYLSQINQQIVPASTLRSNVAFVTSDIMNALAATAEDISTFYVFRLQTEKREFNIFYSSLPDLIFNTAIQFGECDFIVRIKGKNDKYKVVGMWSGKTVHDWQNENIILESNL